MSAVAFSSVLILCKISLSLFSPPSHCRCWRRHHWICIWMLFPQKQCDQKEYKEHHHQQQHRWHRIRTKWRFNTRFIHSMHLSSRVSLQRIYILDNCQWVDKGMNWPNKYFNGFVLSFLPFDQDTLPQWFRSPVCLAFASDFCDNIQV